MAIKALLRYGASNSTLNGKFGLNEGVEGLDRVNKTLSAKIKKAKRQSG